MALSAGTVRAFLGVLSPQAGRVSGTSHGVQLRERCSCNTKLQAIVDTIINVVVIINNIIVINININININIIIIIIALSSSSSVIVITIISRARYHPTTDPK